MVSKYILPSGSEVDLDYFAEWRSLIWRGPLLRALKYLGDLHGKRVLEIGGRSGRLASLYAMMGADVTMLEVKSLDAARREVRTWGVEDRVRLIQTKGGLSELQGQEFDVICAKSVLWSIEHLGPFLDQIECHLAEGGRIAFVENNRGGRLICWLRRNVVHRGNLRYARSYFGIHPGQFPDFCMRFDDVQIVRENPFVFTITGQKKLELCSPATGAAKNSSTMDGANVQ